MEVIEPVAKILLVATIHPHHTVLEDPTQEIITIMDQIVEGIIEHPVSTAFLLLRRNLLLVLHEGMSSSHISLNHHQMLHNSLSNYNVF